MTHRKKGWMCTSWRNTWQEQCGSKLHCCESTECNKCNLAQKLKAAAPNLKIEMTRAERWWEMGIQQRSCVSLPSYKHRGCVTACASFSCCLASLGTTAAPWAYLSSEIYSHLHGAGNWEHVQKSGWWVWNWQLAVPNPKPRKIVNAAVATIWLCHRAPKFQQCKNMTDVKRKVKLKVQYSTSLRDWQIEGHVQTYPHGLLTAYPE
jgi:hypothetical protein